MLAKEIYSILNADPRSSAELGEAAGLNPASIRLYRSNFERLSGASLKTVEKLIGGLRLQVTMKQIKSK